MATALLMVAARDRAWNCLNTVFALVIAIVAVALIGGAALLLCPSVLRRWYLHEVRGMEIAEDPSEAIVTYPLA